MKSKIKKLNGTQRELHISLSPERVEELFNMIIEDIRKEATLPGFRKGMAPLDLIQKNYRKDAMDEVRKRLIPAGYQEALDHHNVTPVSYPELSNILFTSEGGLQFTAKVDVHPDVKLQKYKGIDVKRDKVSVTDKEVEDALAGIRNMYAEYMDVDRAIKKGDFGICSVEAFIDGKSISQKRESVWIEAEKERSMLGLGEELCGLSKGEKKTVEVTLPEAYPDKKYAGKRASFQIEVKEVKEKKLPGLDDELAKKLGKDNLDLLKEELRSQMLARKEADSQINMKNQIIEYLIKKHSFDLPASMVARQLEVLMQRAEEELAQKGVEEKAIKEHRDKLRESLKTQAEDKVKLYFLLDKIASEEGVSVSDDEVDDWLRRMADYYKQPFDKVKKYYEDNNFTEGVKEQLREDKTLDVILTEAVIKEK